MTSDFMGLNAFISKALVPCRNLQLSSLDSALSLCALASTPVTNLPLPNNRDRKYPSFLPSSAVSVAISLFPTASGLVLVLCPSHGLLPGPLAFLGVVGEG